MIILVIRRYDKGQAIFIDGAENYKQRVETQLSDTTSFIDISNDKNIIKSVTSKVEHWAEAYRDHWTPKLMQFLFAHAGQKPGILQAGVPRQNPYQFCIKLPEVLLFTFYHIPIKVE